MQSKQVLLFWVFILIFFGSFAYLVSDVLTPFVFGAIVAYFLDPAADKFEKLGFSRNVATSLVLLIFTIILVLVLILLGPVIADQFKKLVINLPIYLSDLQDSHGEQLENFIKEYIPMVNLNLQDAVHKYSVQIVQVSTSLLKGVLSSGGAVFSIVSLIVISPIIAFYMIRDWDIMVEKIDSLLPRNRRKEFRGEFKKIDDIISAYIRGQVSVCLIMAVYYSIGLSVINLNYAIAIGMLTGLLSFIPYVGMALGVLCGIGVAYFQFGFESYFYYTAIIFIIGNIVEGNLITPFLVGNKVKLHPAWIIFALMAGGAIFGFVGVLIAIPVAAVLGVLTRTSVEKYKKSDYYDPAVKGMKNKNQEPKKQTTKASKTTSKKTANPKKVSKNIKKIED